MKNKILITASDYYTEITEMLVKDAKTVLEKESINYEIIMVPGVFEIPAAIKFASKHYIGFVALGCVIRGETSHYDYVCNESARGLMDLSLQGIVIGYGILTVENINQALERSKSTKTKSGKGIDATMACINQLYLKRKYSNAKN